MLTRRYALCSLAAAVGALSLDALAQASFPSRVIKYIVPFPAGGLTDMMARVVGQKLTESLGQAVVVENRPGASANLGADAAAKSLADGYTWLAVTMTHAVNQTLFPDLPYSLEKNFTPVVHLATSRLVLVVNTASPAKTLAEFLTLARTKSLAGGSSGNGTPPHLGLELLALISKAELLHIPYKGGAPSINDLLGAQIDFIVSNLPECLAHIKGGKLRALAVTSARRHSLLPTVPTFAEAGLAGMEIENWTGMLMPSGTPAAVVNRVAAESIKAITPPDVVERVVSMGFTPTGLGPAEFSRIIQTDVARWRDVIRARNIKPG